MLLIVPHLEMLFYFVAHGSNPLQKFLASIFEFSQLLNGGLVKGLSPNLIMLCQFVYHAIFSPSPIEMYHYFVHDSIKPREKFCRSFLKFSYLLIVRLVKRLTPNEASFCTF